MIFVLTCVCVCVCVFVCVESVYVLLPFTVESGSSARET